MSGETTVSNQQKQPSKTAKKVPIVTTKQTEVTASAKQLKSLVKQSPTAETANKETTVSKEVKQPTKTAHTKESETVVLLDTNIRYLKQKCRQAYKRMKTQENPTTPKKNYERLKGHLEMQGYEVEPKPIDGNPYYVDIFKQSDRK